MTKKEFERFKDFINKYKRVKRYYLWVKLNRSITTTDETGSVYTNDVVLSKGANLSNVLKNDKILKYNYKHILFVSLWVETNNTFVYF